MLRPANSDEFLWIANLIHDAFAGYSARLDKERARRPKSSQDWVKDAVDSGSVHVFEADGQPLGVVILSEKDGAAHINQIAIAPEFQGLGHGGALLQAAENHAAAQGHTMMRLHTAQPMTELVSFYSRAGYRIVKLAPRCQDPDGIDRVYFEKPLSRKA